LLDSFYYKSCRVIRKDFECQISRENNQIVKSATPSEFSNFCLAGTVILAYNSKTSLIKDSCSENFYQINQKPYQIFFFDASRIRIEKNSLKNRISEVFKAINFPWLTLKYETLRPKLKKIFFDYSN